MAEELKIKSMNTTSDQLRQEYERQVQLFDSQQPIVQRFLEAQAQQIATSYVDRAPSIHFTLPDRVTLPGNKDSLMVLGSMRQQRVGNIRTRLAGTSIHDILRRRLAELEQSNNLAVIISAELIRYSTAIHMIHYMLPSGKIVHYLPIEEGDIPSIPTNDASEPESAITAATDAISESGSEELGRGGLQVPYVSKARRFYLPQWVAFDDELNMLVKSTEEAEAHIASMQRFLDVLFAVRSLAPFMIADDEFEKKRYGMLGQLVNQGRALALYMNKEIIRLVKERASAQSLNRGLSLRLPYFDDQDLRIKTYNFVVIPAGRIMFVPAFVVRAALEESAKIAQDTRYSTSTKRHLIAELQTLGEAFESPIID
jgi:hypothetical protein